MTTTLQQPMTMGSDDVREANRQIAVDFLALSSDGHAKEAWDRYGTPDFVHHNPWFRSDGPSLIAGMDENAHENPEKRLEILHTVAEGPLVAVHSRVRLKAEGPDYGLAHLFRIEDGRIHELWDLAMQAPADSPNERGMF